jgi:HEAT repeat protein
MMTSAAAWCRSRRWWRRLRGVRTLTLLRATEPDLTPMLADRVPDVRAEVATWIAANPTDERLVALIAMLDDPDARCRWAAQDALLRIGRPATHALAAHLAASPRRPVEALRVAAGLAAAHELLAPALAYCADERAEVRVAAAEAVTAVGGERTTEVLRSLLADDDARVRTAAATGLGELEHWPAQAELVRAMDDPVWEVRRAAAAALQRFGPVGRIQLRRAVESSDPHVAEMASHVLDLSDLALVVTP